MELAWYVGSLWVRCRFACSRIVFFYLTVIRVINHRTDVFFLHSCLPLLVFSCIRWRYEGLKARYSMQKIRISWLFVKLAYLRCSLSPPMQDQLWLFLSVLILGNWGIGCIHWWANISCFIRLWCLFFWLWLWGSFLSSIQFEFVFRLRLCCKFSLAFDCRCLFWRLCLSWRTLL